MMNGEDNQNDDKKVENPGKESSQSEENAAQNEAADTGLLSDEAEIKSYPFALPTDESNEAPPAAQPPQDMQEPEDIGEDASVQSTEEDAAIYEDIAQSDDNVLSEDEDDIEASLDEGIFSNETLQEDGVEDQMPQELDDMEGPGSEDGDPSHEAQAPRDETPVDEEVLDEMEPVQEPEISQEEGQPEQHAAIDSSLRPGLEPAHSVAAADHGAKEQPSHAFDMGAPEMSEKEFSETIEKKSRIGTIVAGLVIFLLLIGLIIGGGYFYVNVQFDAPGSHTQSLTHVIKPKQGLKVIAEDLEKKGIIKDKNVFMLGSYLKKSNTNLKAGEFEFAPNASMSDVLKTITKGKVLQHKITFAEGLTTQQIIELINKNPVLVGDVEKTPEEGTLLPETYQFERGMTRQQIIDRMAKAQSDLVEKLWPDRDDDLGVVTPGDAVILASIIEKETGLSAERTRVSSVFNNRLRKNMRLQSDPTVIYGIVGGAGKLDRPIRRSDLDAKTPYNTYQIKGLPPTPIANPGKASLEAALRPAKTKDLFFVADGTGGHAFARTLQEHNENVARWRKLESGVTAPEPTPVKKGEDTAKKVKETGQEKTGVLKKTTTLNTDKKTSIAKPEKSDLVAPTPKPKIETPKVAKEVVKKKENLSEKVKSIFVKPEEAPLPRQKPDALINQGSDQIKVTPLPEQKVPQVNVNTPRVPKVSRQQISPPPGEPTPELETVKPAPTQKPFNPFDN
jgi:UPF0755 protein